jgi:polyhydroxybutyrate depolymerase
MKSSLYPFFLFFFLVVFPKANAQVRTDSLLIDGGYRSFHFHHPTGGTPKQNLIFVLHGSGGNGKGMMEPASSLEALAARENFMLVFPDGYKKYWNECRKEATSLANKEDINEQAFFHGMLAYFRQNYQVGADKFFVIGMSGGGHMAYKLALTMPDQCKGISAIVANLPEAQNLDCVEAGKPVAVMISNGTQDSINPYEGGEMAVNGSSFGLCVLPKAPFGIGQP